MKKQKVVCNAGLNDDEGEKSGPLETWYHLAFGKKLLPFEQGFKLGEVVPLYGVDDWVKGSMIETASLEHQPSMTVSIPPKPDETFQPLIGRVGNDLFAVQGRFLVLVKKGHTANSYRVHQHAGDLINRRSVVCKDVDYRADGLLKISHSQTKKHVRKMQSWDWK